MQRKGFKSNNFDYLRQTEKPYPKTIYWEVISPKGHKLSSLQDHDVVFDDYDMKIRQLSV